METTGVIYRLYRVYIGDYIGLMCLIEYGVCQIKGPGPPETLGLLGNYRGNTGSPAKDAPLCLPQELGISQGRKP